ncbi:hypothetical protein EDB82DRAFT_568151 [Fusarium venenatum]|uniref:uncharacterized protein n=1 Tax=Fusarium venenatum TaxID=56646 RepID=UPI001DBF493B|nr:hypothetical protein EDB82DRAFT_568151 [Fusarium venenatum]
MTANGAFEEPSSEPASQVKPPWEEETRDIENKEIVLITAYHVVIGSCKAVNGEEAIAQLETEFPDTKSSVDVVQIDLGNSHKIPLVFETIKSKFGRVDVLVNNAGANFDSFEENDGADPARARLLFNKTYNNNVSGTQVFTATFIPLLLESSSPRIIFLTSGLSTLHGTHESFLSKNHRIHPERTALNMVMLSWYQLLKEDGVRVWSGAGYPATGGELILKVIEGEKDEDVGKVVSQDGVQEW